MARSRRIRRATPIPLPPSAGFKVFHTKTILSSILSYFPEDQETRKLLAGVMRVCKIGVEVAAPLLYKDASVIRDKDYKLLKLYDHFLSLKVPHSRVILYTHSVKKIQVAGIQKIEDVPQPLLLASYPNLLSIHFELPETSMLLDSQIEIIRTPNEPTFSKVAMSCMVDAQESKSSEFDVHTLYGMNNKTGKGFDGLELSKLEFSDYDVEESCTCTIYECESSGYHWVFAAGGPLKRNVMLNSLKELNLGKQACSYTQLVNLATAIPEITHLTVHCAAYQDKEKPGDNLELIGSLLTKLEKFVVRDWEFTWSFSLTEVIKNLRDSCPNLKELEIPIDLKVTKDVIETDENLGWLLGAPTTTTSSDIAYDEGQFTNLRIWINPDQLGSFPSLKFSYLLLQAVSESCKVEILAGHNPDEDDADDIDGLDDYADKCGRYRERKRWIDEVMSSREILSEQIEEQKLKENQLLGIGGSTVSVLQRKKGWSHVGPVGSIGPSSSSSFTLDGSPSPNSKPVR